MAYRGKFAHKLVPNKTGSFPRHVIFFDTETESRPDEYGNQEAVFKLAWYCQTRYTDTSQGHNISTWTEFREKTGQYTLVDLSVAAKTCLYLVSANIWFDLRVSGLLRDLIDNGWKIENFWGKGLVQIFSFRKTHCNKQENTLCTKCTKGKCKHRQHRKIMALNFQNWFHCSVAKAGKEIGLPKLGIDFDKDDIDTLSTYCYRDVEIIKLAFEQWIHFIQKHDLGTFGRTLSSQAFNAFRHRFMSHDIFIHNTNRAVALERSGYCGGRVECFFIGKRSKLNTYKLDINSMYPFVMAENLYPVKLMAASSGLPIEHVIPLLKKGRLMARVLLETDTPAYAVKLHHKTVFPVGTFEAVLCSAGLERAAKCGEIKEIYEYTYYYAAMIFTEYIDFFHRLKIQYEQEENRVYRYIIKTFMNSLYGKFGQRADNTVFDGPCDPELMESEDYYNGETRKHYIVTRLGGRETWVEQGVNEGLHSFVAVAAHVTEYARLLLWQYIEIAGINNCYYCDTDSLFVNDKGYKNLARYLHDTKLGMFKLEDKTRRLVVYGCKDYIFKGKPVLKGVRKDAIKTARNTYNQVWFPGPRTELKEGVKETYTIRRKTKVLKRIYDKGIIQKDGRVTPLILNTTIEPD